MLGSNPSTESSPEAKIEAATAPPVFLPSSLLAQCDKPN